MEENERESEKEERKISKSFSAHPLMFNSFYYIFITEFVSHFIWFQFRKPDRREEKCVLGAWRLMWRSIELFISPKGTFEALIKAILPLAHMWILQMRRNRVKKDGGKAIGMDEKDVHIQKEKEKTSINGWAVVKYIRSPHEYWTSHRKTTRCVHSTIRFVPFPCHCGPFY